MSATGRMSLPESRREDLQLRVKSSRSAFVPSPCNVINSFRFPGIAHEDLPQ
jgi:hypothetical protein